MKYSIRFPVLSALFKKISIALLVLFSSVSIWADLINGSFFLDFETSTDGTVITTNIVGAATSTYGSIGSWDTLNGSEEAVSSGTVPRLTIENDASFSLYTPVSLNGTFYTGVGGTRGMRAANVSGENNAIELDFTSPMNSISVGFNFRFNGNKFNWSPRDLVVMNDADGDFQIMQVYDQASDSPGDRPYVQTHFQGGAGNGNDVYFDRNYWYWVTIFRAAASGTMKISFYDATNQTLIGESTGTVSSGTGPCEWITFGTHKYDFASSQTFDFDNIVINTNGVYPLGPGGGPIIPPSRKPDFSRNLVGIEGGIPNRTTIYDTLDPGDNIQTALDACPVGQVVKLNAGTFTLPAGGLRIEKSITLRGAGPNSTILVYDGADGITIESSVLTGSVHSNNLHTGHLIKGSSNVTTAATITDLYVGYIVTFDQLSDDSYLVFPTGNNGSRTDTSRNAGTRVRSQASKITAISQVTNLTIWPPLVYHLTNTMDPELYFRKASSTTNNYVNFAGVESLTLTNISGSAGTSIYFNRSENCWASNVVSRQSYEWHISMLNSFRNEIRYSQFIGAKTTANGAGYGVSLDYQTSFCLIEDNIFRDFRQFVQVNGGGVGNIVAYNYMTNATANSGATSYTVKTGGHHNAHPMMNLFEGNVAYKFAGDFNWGSSSHNTVFRNWFKALMPYSSQGGTSMELEESATYYNIVGNILGYSGITNHSGFSGYSSLKISPATINYANDYATFKIGYYNSSEEGSGENQTNQWNNYIVGGNYDYVSAAQGWYSTTNVEPIPDSYIYTSKPAFFGALSWPPFNPSGPTIGEELIPAGERAQDGEDVAGPILLTATIGSAGTSLTLGFDESVTRNSGTPTLDIAGGSVTATYSSGSGTSSHVYTLSRTAYSGQTGDLDTSLSANGWEDSLGNDFADVTNFTITNNSSQTLPSGSKSGKGNSIGRSANGLAR